MSCLEKNSLLSECLAYDELQPSVNNVSSASEDSKFTNDSIILIHGLFCAKETMKDLASNLHAQTGSHVIAVDLRNHGSSFHSSTMNYASLAGDIAVTMKSLDLRSAVVIGHSLGGKVAMTLALTNPHLVSKLVVEDVAPDTIDMPPILLDMFAAIRATDWSTLPVDPAQAKLLLHPLLRASVEVANIGVKDGQCYWKMNVSALEQNISQLFSFPHQGLQFTKPALFIGGDLSPAMLPESDKDILQYFPRAIIAHVPDVGHWIHTERLDKFTTLVTTFLKET